MSKGFPEFDKLNLPEIAEGVLDFWKKNEIFEQSVDNRKDEEPFVFFEGPPSANGLPGIHHVMARSIKDIFCRYKTQSGYRVERKAGWDTHGLPVELGVEKELGITKEDIGDKISVEAYNEACKNAVMRYTDVWSDLTEKMGYWVDMDDPYVTYRSKYMETLWWLLAEVYKKGLMYKGYTVQPYSPKAGTGLSSHELNQPGTYQEVSDTTVTAQFKAVQEDLPDFLQNEDNPLYFIAWTTTPWTLPSNTALTVGPKIDYVLVRTYNQYTFEPVSIVVAKNLVHDQFAKKFQETEDAKVLADYTEGDKTIPYQICEEFKGKDFVGVRYEQLLPYALPFENPENAFRIIAGDFVTTEDGTGIVHTAPTFGADDSQVAKSASPEVPPMLVKDDNDKLVPLVDLQGRFRSEMGDLAGKYVKSEYYDEGEAPEKSVDVELAIKLKEENKAFIVEKYRHTYPNCWRTDKPILYYPLDSWFIKVTDVKDRMHDLNKTIHWKPKSTGEGRFGNWLANANDWNLSRSRYWGTPLPIWRTEEGEQEMIISSIKELKEEIKKSIAAGVMKTDPYEGFEPGDMSDENYEQVDLHKDVVDAIVLVAEDGSPMYREPDLIDVWFDSGSMPYAQWHYPFENKNKVEDGARKADFIAEGVDQTRGWFYTLHAIATLNFDDIAYKNVISNGLVLDKNGQKMSKSKGNAVDPFETLAAFGPDATRWYMISNANPWDNLKFDLEGVGETSRKFFGTLYNTYSFFVMYANIDQFDPEGTQIPVAKRPEIDRWILSELHSLIGKVDSFLDDYEPTKAAREISEFVQENLSNWYVRLNRRRFWKPSDAQNVDAENKTAAYQTLYECLMTIAKLSAPIAPFYMEKLYRDLTANNSAEKEESVHLTRFPQPDEQMLDKALEAKMQKAQTISSLALSLRKKEKIKVRQPLGRLMIPVLDQTEKEELQSIEDLIKSEINVKNVEFIDDASGLLVKSIKPNFRILGPRFGKAMGAVNKAVSRLDAAAIDKIENEEALELDIDGNTERISREEVDITSEDIEGWLVATKGSTTVALDLDIDQALKDEGITRELVNRIQNLRKDSGFEVTDHISLQVEDHAEVQKAVEANEDYLKTETLTDQLDFKGQLTQGTAVEFDNIQTKINIEKL